MGRLQDKIAIVTGAASGLGRAVATRFIAEGARVVVGDINEQAGQALADALGEHATYHHHDVASEASWSALMAAVTSQVGPPQVLVNNAGILLPGTVEDATLDQWQRLMQINAASCFLGCKFGVAAMKAQGGAIVNIASISSWLPIDGYVAYSASKAAVGAVTRSAALHCRKQGYPVRINSVHPDGVYTPMMEASAPGVDAKYLLFDRVTNRRGRACLPEQVASVVLFLASEDASYVSGTEMRVDNAIQGMGL
ncbi:short-chain dehydrogenase [Cupriavidus necator]|uniref:Short-chain dehydrogenase n=1 Tax=Cupriavidus necator TaxID=106590 RepID=A0A1U9UZZ0_CUPNE|nr:SDR family oxidoreductase [Cupriavidus necator]AQV98288.1 short-chain dehydrogenase [Cupriavidus necator]